MNRIPVPHRRRKKEKTSKGSKDRRFLSEARQGMTMNARAAASDI